MKAHTDRGACAQSQTDACVFTYAHRICLVIPYQKYQDKSLWNFLFLQSKSRPKKRITETVINVLNIDSLDKQHPVEIPPSISLLCVLCWLAIRYNLGL